MGKRGRDSGQTAAEYLGVLFVVCLIIATIAQLGLDQQIGCQVRIVLQRGLGADVDTHCGPPQRVAARAAPDADGDGLSDALEGAFGTNARKADSDGDGLTDGEEARHGSDPVTADTDGDGISDGEEERAHTDPRTPDTDGDGMGDAEEIELGLNPRRADTDRDGLSDLAEMKARTDPLDPDTDDDGHPDGKDKDPGHYDAGLGDVLLGGACGDSTFWKCPDDDDPVRASLPYFAGQTLVGLFAIGDVRDLISALARGKLGDAAWSAAGIVPGFGDAAKIGRRVEELLRRFPERRAEILDLINRLVPERLRHTVFDAATGGGYSAMVRGGVPEDTIKALERAGNDLKRLSDNATLETRVLSDSEATEMWRRAKDPARWGDRAVRDNGSGLGERIGVETALTELERDPDVEILVDGLTRRPGPDIVAYNHRTNRLIVTEAKGTVEGARALGKYWLRTPLNGGHYTEGALDWLKQDPGRYMGSLANGTSSERRAHDLLEGVLKDQAPYDVLIVQGRPIGGGGFGPGLDESVENIRAQGNGQVGEVRIVDVQRPQQNVRPARVHR